MVGVDCQRCFNRLAPIRGSRRLYQNEYVSDLSAGWERDLVLALALTGSSRAMARLGDLDRALSDCRVLLQHAANLNIDAFVLMALIPVAEIAATRAIPIRRHS